MEAARSSASSFSISRTLFATSVRSFSRRDMSSCSPVLRFFSSTRSARTFEWYHAGAVVAETQRVLGHTLSGPDMKLLFGMYDYLALPPEVILELLNFCVDRSREKYGTGRLPSMRSIEKEAFVWVNREILTLEQAEEYIEACKARSQDVAKAAAVLGIRGRELSPTEQKYIGEWLDLGFGREELSAAYDRTVTNTGSLKWPYMNRIILSWHEKGLHTIAEISEKDGPARRQALPAAEAPRRSNAESLSALKSKIKSPERK